MKPILCPVTNCHASADSFGAIKAHHEAIHGSTESLQPGEKETVFALPPSFDRNTDMEWLLLVFKNDLFVVVYAVYGHRLHLDATQLTDMTAGRVTYEGKLVAKFPSGRHLGTWFDFRYRPSMEPPILFINNVLKCEELLEASRGSVGFGPSIVAHITVIPKTGVNAQLGPFVSTLPYPYPILQQPQRQVAVAAGHMLPWSTFGPFVGALPSRYDPLYSALIRQTLPQLAGPPQAAVLCPTALRPVLPMPPLVLQPVSPGIFPPQPTGIRFESPSPSARGGHNVGGKKRGAGLKNQSDTGRKKRTTSADLCTTSKDTNGEEPDDKDATEDYKQKKT